MGIYLGQWGQKSPGGSYRRGQGNPLILSDSQRGQRESERGEYGYCKATHSGSLVDCLK